MTPQKYAEIFVSWSHANGVTNQPYVGLQKNYMPVAGFVPSYVIEWTTPSGSVYQQNASIGAFRAEDHDNLGQQGLLNEVIVLVGGGPIVTPWETFIAPPKPVTPGVETHSPIGAQVPAGTVALYIAPERPLIRADRNYFLPSVHGIEVGMGASWQGRDFLAIRATPFLVWMMEVG